VDDDHKASLSPETIVWNGRLAKLMKNLYGGKWDTLSFLFRAKASNGDPFQRIKLVAETGHSPKPQKLKEIANKFVMNLCGLICQFSHKPY